MTDHIKVQGVELCVFQDRLFESYEVAALLGYSQHSSLRKQTLTDWKNKLFKGQHYEMVHDEDTLLEYDALFRRIRGIVLAPVKPKRGRLFFSAQGLLAVLNRSSKPTEELRAALMRAGYFDNVRGHMIVKDEPVYIAGQPCRRCKRPLDEARDCPCTPVPKQVAAPPAPVPQDERLFHYEVMQKLLEQLERLDDPQLRDLAISAAEVALGRELKELRAPEKTKAAIKSLTTILSPPVTQPPPVKLKTLVGVFFKEEGYYSMTRIGELAGGFTAQSAGKAVDLVGHRLGYTHAQLRNNGLPFNQIMMRPDSTSGKKRPMVRFDRDFANKVVHELRTNPKFEPTLTPGIPTPGPVDLGEREVTYPKLSRGPFDS